MAIFYHELPFRDRTDKAIYYKCKIRAFHYKPTLESDNEIDHLLSNGLTINDIAASLSAKYLTEANKHDGLDTDEYSEWLDEIISICPTDSFPITEEPTPGGSYPPYNHVVYYNSSVTDPIKSLPSGLRGASNPWSETNEHK